MDTNTKNHYNKIDGLRVWAAIGIVMMHVQANMGCEISGFVFEKLIPSFTDGVFLFMVISGFSTCCGYFDMIAIERVPLERFYKRRFSKVWYFFSLLCLLEFAVAPSREAAFEVLANMTLCFGLIPDHGIEVIGVGWFIGLVFVFYFLFPFFCYLLSDKKRAWISFGVSLLLNYLCVEYFDVGRMSIAYSAVFFMLGGILFLYRTQLQYCAERFGFPVLIAGIGAAVLYYAFEECVPVRLLLCGVLLVYALGGRKHKFDLLDNPVTRALSGISMEIYLSHMVVFRALEICMRGRFQTEGNGVRYAVMTLGTLTGTVAFSWIVKKLLTGYSEWKKRKALGDIWNV